MKKELLRQILAQNVARRMEETPGLETQPALAKKAGIGQSHVSRILGGEQSIGLDVVAAVSDAFGCEPWELLADSEATRQAALQKMILGPRVADERAAAHLPPEPRGNDHTAPTPKVSTAKRRPRKQKKRGAP